MNISRRLKRRRSWNYIQQYYTPYQWYWVTIVAKPSMPVVRRTSLK